MTDQAKLPLRVTSYMGDDGIERCLDCDGFLAKPGAKCKRCANRVKAAKDVDTAATKAADAAEAKKAHDEEVRAQISRWREHTMRRYIVGLLATESGSIERQRYFEKNPISEIFK